VPSEEAQSPPCPSGLHLPMAVCTELYVLQQLSSTTFSDCQSPRCGAETAWSVTGSACGLSCSPRSGTRLQWPWSTQGERLGLSCQLFCCGTFHTAPSAVPASWAAEPVTSSPSEKLKRKMKGQQYCSGRGVLAGTGEGLLPGKGASFSPGLLSFCPPLFQGSWDAHQASPRPQRSLQSARG
jgi:hypothetical protein